MFKRTCWLLVTLLSPFLMLTGIGGMKGMMAETAVAAAAYDVIISEVGWGGTASSSSDEWIELYNKTNSAVNLLGWTLGNASDSISITLQGTIPAQGFYLLERTNDDSISDIPANQFYSGGLSNSGDRLYLRDDSNQIIDSANADGGGWPAGSGSPNYYSMERTSRDVIDGDANWESNNGVIRNGLDADGGLINGTPKSNNSGWSVSDEVDLAANKEAPVSVDPGGMLVYSISVENKGSLMATNVVLTDTLPEDVAYVSASGGFPLNQPDASTLVWQIGELAASGAIQVYLTTTVDSLAVGSLENVITATTGTMETILSNNWDSAVTVINNAGETAVLLDAILYDGWSTGDADEAVSLRNIGELSADLNGWQLNNKPLPNITLASGETVWLAKDASAFTKQFGFAPDGVLASWPGFANSGDEVLLANDHGQIVDVLVYEGGNTGQSGWSGTAVQPFPVAGQEGQILYRI